MLALVLYCALMIWAICRLSDGLALLSWANRSEGSRLAMHCGRNPYAVSMRSASVPLYRWSGRASA